MGYLDNKGVYFPLKQKTREGINSPNDSQVALLLKDMLLDVQVIGAKRGKYYRIEWIGLGTTAWGTPSYEMILGEYDESTYATSTTTKKDVIKLFHNNFGKTPNGITTQTFFSPDGEYILNATLDYNELTVKGITWGSIVMNDKAQPNNAWSDIIDPACYVYTKPKQSNYFKYNYSDPANPVLEVFGLSGLDVYRFLFDKRTVNRLFALYNVHKKQSIFGEALPFDPAATYQSNTVYAIAPGNTDFVSPYVSKAALNGDANPTVIFTGGAHSTNNNATTGNPTAVTDSIDIVADGNRISVTAERAFKKLDIYVKNRIMSYNTVGTGRYTHIETVHYSIEGTKIDVEVSIQPLEHIKLYTYYGLQADVQFYTSLFYKGGQSLTDQPRGQNTDSGAKKDYFASKAVAYKRNSTIFIDEIMEMEMDNTIGLGKRQSVDDTLSTIFATTGNKVYMRLVGFWGNNKEMDMFPNYTYQWKGNWHYKSIY